MRPGALYLVPVTLGDDAAVDVIPVRSSARIHALNYFIVEEPKRARAFLKALAYPRPLATARIEKLEAEATEATCRELLTPVLKGVDAGLLSGAGAPAVADPGARLVQAAHEAGIQVVPSVGPSAILLALMASGLEGQRFAFHGYLPIEAPALKERLHALEADSRRERRTEIFIETPYRNDRLLHTILATCTRDTRLCVAVDLTLATETIATRAIADWQRAPPTLGKRPAVFLLLAGPGR